MSDQTFLLPFALLGAAILAGAPAQTDVVAMPLPPGFEANQGQMPPDVKYFARGRSYTLALSQRDVRLSPADGLGDVVIAFPSSKLGKARIEAEDPLPFHINSIKGADPRRWITNSPVWSRVRYRQIQPGIDLVFHRSTQTEARDTGTPDWEYDFELAPRADPSRIQFEVRGAASLEVDSGGNLLAHTPGGASIHWRKPASYQTSGNDTRAISTAFVVSGMRVSFSLDNWDRSEPLVIDPAFVFSTYFGGSGNEIARGIGRDSSGNIYICGSTSSGNLPTSAASYQANFRGGSAFYDIGDAFIAKFTSSGGLSYVTYLGGAADDIATSLAVDSTGNVYVTGFTASSDFPYLKGFQNYYGGSGGNHFGEGGDAFVAKFTNTGALVYSTYLGGSQDDAGLAITVDASGNAYVAGSTLSTNFPASGGYQTTFGGTDPSFINANGYVGLHLGDAFVAKISASGQQLVAATYLGGILDDAADAIALDSNGNVWVGGQTNSANFPVVNPLQGTFGGNSPGSLQPVAMLGDGFVSKLNSNLTSLLYSTFLGGSGDDGVTAIVVDSGGSAYLAGLTLSANFPTTTGVTFKGPTTLAAGRAAATGDAFLAKLNPSGKALTYSTLLGGSDNEFASGLAVDAAGNAYIAGTTSSIDFPLTGQSLQHNFGGAVPPDGVGDAFLAMFDPAGRPLYSSYLGGNGQDIALGLALDGAGSAYITGLTGSSNFPTATAYQGVLKSTNPGGYNAFLTVVSGLVSLPPALSITKSHMGSFTQGQSNAAYTVTVSNQTGANATSGTVTVTETVPTGLTLVSMTGTNWACTGNACTRSSALTGGSSYEPITVTVNVSSSAPAQVINQVSVSGGGSATANASDSTTVATSGQPPAAVTIFLPAQGAAGVSLTPTLTWGAATGATSYDVYFGTSATPGFVMNTTGTSYTPAALSPNTTYYWYLISRNATGTTPSLLWSFTTGASGHPTFFAGEVALTNGVYYLQFPNGNLFGYYTYQFFPVLYHFDLGFESYINANDGQAGAYFYDFASNHWFYTSPGLFPYLYDFTLNSWLYYFLDTKNPGHYTANPRYFSDINTGKIITM